jgi:hypothetical protein
MIPPRCGAINRDDHRNGFRFMKTTFRALIMLSVLVGLPAAWIYYGPLPPDAQRVVDRVTTVAREAIGWKQAPQKTKENWVQVKPESEALSEAPPAPTPIVGVGFPETEPVVATLAGTPKPLSFAERVEPLLARLRQLGASEYALEHWGDGGELYRFHCEMPVAASPQLTQQFEAVAADPQATVERVVAEVASWQIAR